jgi:hypothetical protein
MLFSPLALPDIEIEVKKNGKETKAVARLKVNGRRPSMRFIASSGARGGIGDIVGREATLFEDLSSSSEKNDAVNGLREDVREWRGNHYPGTALVTRRLLEWWFERGDERKALGKRFVYDAFESGLVKVVRLPDPDDQRRIYLDLWDLVKGAKTKEEFLRAWNGSILAS